MLWSNIFWYVFSTHPLFLLLYSSPPLFLCFFFLISHFSIKWILLKWLFQQVQSGESHSTIQVSRTSHCFMFIFVNCFSLYFSLGKEGSAKVHIIPYFFYTALQEVSWKMTCLYPFIFSSTFLDSPVSTKSREASVSTVSKKVLMVLFLRERYLLNEIYSCRHPLSEPSHTLMHDYIWRSSPSCYGLKLYLLIFLERGLVLFLMLFNCYKLTSIIYYATSNYFTAF